MFTKLALGSTSCGSLKQSNSINSTTLHKIKSNYSFTWHRNLSSGGGITTETALSPSARHLIDKNRLQAQLIKGTGRRGLIMKEDVLRFLSEPQKSSAQTAATPFQTQHVEKQMQMPMSSAFPRNSKATIPHLYLTAVDDLLQVRSALNKTQTTKISTTELAVRACALAIRHYPEFNAAWVNEDIKQRRTIDLNVALFNKQEMSTALVTKADTKGILRIAEDIQQSTPSAPPATLTIYNLMDTPLGIDHFAEVIQPNQTAALTVGKIRKWVTVDEKGQPYIGNIVDITLSCDSRVVEEETAAKFLDLFSKLLGHPQSLLTE